MTLPAPVQALPTALVAGAAVLTDRDAYLPLLPKNAVICEVGIGLGGFSRAMIDHCQPSHFIAIDNFRLHTLPEFWGHPPFHWFGEKTHADWYRDSFSTRIAAGGMTVIEADSHQGLEQLDDASVDVFYIDGDHTYEAIRRDLAVAIRKIKPDGYLIINDYVMIDQLGAREPYGVIYATHEFMIEHQWAMLYFALQTNMFCDVVLRRAGAPPPPPLGGVPPGQGTKSATLDRTGVPHAAADAEIVSLKQEIAMLRNSTSWRITGPLRRARDWFLPRR